MWETQPDDTTAQYLCLDSLTEFGPEVFGSLMEASGDCRPEVRAAIPKVLAVKWGTVAVPHLVECSKTRTSRRKNAAKELGKLKDKRATDALIHHWPTATRM